jgi:tetratricopeptide (TPR) repeat protein
MRPEGTAEASAQARARGAKAVSLAATGKLDAALDMARESVTEADADDYAALAAGYNTLGRCYEAADRDRDALYAYLHTDYLFNTDPSTHAEALSRLTELWRAAGKPDAAKEARTRLERRYAATPWARAAAGPQAN